MKIHTYNLPGTQSGVVLIIILTIIVIGAAGVFMATANYKQRQVTVNNSSHGNLDQIKKAIVGWSLSHPDKPGMLPWPDSRTDSNYDGNSDCLSNTPSYTSLLGRVPWLGQTNPCVAPLTGMSVRSIDATGAPVYYAASPNLVYNYNSGAYPTINSSTRELNTGWLTVIDRRGNVLSNRVAFVVIAPGRALSNQQRNGAIPATDQYLDSVTVNGTLYNNANSSGVFVSGQPDDSFNDLIQYITIDQLMVLVEKRVLRELKSCLDRYAVANGGTYPYPINMNGESGANSNSNSNDDASNDDNASANDDASDDSNNNSNDDAGDDANDDSSPTVVTTNLFGRFDKSLTWPSTCMINRNYFNDWQDTSFYMVAPGFVSGGNKTCPTCLQLNGSGNYHAMVLLAGPTLGSQTRAFSSDQKLILNYLEGLNLNPYDYLFQAKSQTSTFNDKVMCVDGNQTCK